MSKIEMPSLNEGETYIGVIGNANGELYHVVLMAKEKLDTTWQEAMDWAESIGGDLPNRIEQAMLWAGHKDQFYDECYWTNETHSTASGFAWYQSMIGGAQDIDRKMIINCARSIRRIPI